MKLSVPAGSRSIGFVTLPGSWPLGVPNSHPSDSERFNNKRKTGCSWFIISMVILILKNEINNVKKEK